jgi:hypothetical protein
LLEKEEERKGSENEQRRLFTDENGNKVVENPHKNGLPHKNVLLKNESTRPKTKREDDGERAEEKEKNAAARTLFAQSVQLAHVARLQQLIEQS